MPPPVPDRIDVPACFGLLATARSELDNLARQIAQNPEVAHTLLHMLNRREAVDSSQIEGTHTSFDGLLLHELEQAEDVAPSTDQDADETLAYLRAFMVGSQAVASQGQETVSVALLQQMHGLLLAHNPEKKPGRIREIQNYIGTTLETATFIPPPAAAVPGLLEDLQGLLHYQPEGVVEVSVLMRAAIAHAQFEAIHPFLDGNGRIGRLLLPLIFQAEGLPPIHLATFLKVRQRDYYAALLEVQMRLNWEPWLRLYLECVIASCKHTMQLFTDLHTLHRRWAGLLTAAKKRRHAAVWKVIELLLKQPVVNINEIVRQTGVTFPAANKGVAELVDMGILRPVSAQRRHRAFHAHEVMNALYTGLDQVLEQAAKIGRLC